MDNFNAFRPFAHTRSLKYLPLNERIHLVRCYDTLGKIRIGRFVLPCNGNPVFIVPPLQSCTFNITKSDKILCYSVPLNQLSKPNRQYLLTLMYHEHFHGLNYFVDDNSRPHFTNNESEISVIETINYSLNNAELKELTTNPAYDKNSFLAHQLLSYIIKRPITLEYLNVFTAAKHLGCSPRTLQRLSNGVFGLSIHEIFGHHLAMEGIDRVLYKGESFKEAAKGLGYSNSSAYCKCFKSRMSTSPHKFLEAITARS